MIRSTYPGGITIESGSLESTGGKVWDASLAFYEYLLGCPEFLSKECKSTLELGSGCGWLGMRLSSALPAMNITMSERGDLGALEWLNHNISLNPDCRVDSVELDWANVPEPVITRHWDFIIGCELVYSYEGARLFTSVLHTLLRQPGAVCFYAHSLNRFESVDELMFSEFARHNLNVEIVSGNGRSLDCVGSFEDLFRPIELVIFRISYSFKTDQNTQLLGSSNNG
jgi:hypothetical protein